MFYIIISFYCLLIHACVCQAQTERESDAEVLQYEFDNDGSGPYHFKYATSNHIEREEKVEFTNANGRGDHYVLTGYFSYRGPDGKDYNVKYTADKDGFHPEGDHFTVPPYIPWNVEYNENGEEVFPASISIEEEKSNREPKVISTETQPPKTYLPSRAFKRENRRRNPRRHPDTSENVNIE